MWSPCCPGSDCGQRETTPPSATRNGSPPTDRSRRRRRAGGRTRSATDDPANRVTVPWGTTPTPQVGDVGPLQLSTEVPTLPALNPVTPPVLMPTLPPPAVPTTTDDRTPNDGEGQGDVKVDRETDGQTACRQTDCQTDHGSSKADRQTDDRETVHGRPETDDRLPKPTTAKPTTAAPKPTTASLPNRRPPNRPRPPRNRRRRGGALQSLQPAAGLRIGFLRAAVRLVHRGDGLPAATPSTGNNCAVTMKTADVGKATQVSATLEVQGGGANTDRGNYDFYAGPAILLGKGKCVRISGSGPGGSSGTGWPNCGMTSEANTADTRRGDPGAVLPPPMTVRPTGCPPDPGADGPDGE